MTFFKGRFTEYRIVHFWGQERAIANINGSLIKKLMLSSMNFIAAYSRPRNYVKNKKLMEKNGSLWDFSPRIEQSGCSCKSLALVTLLHQYLYLLKQLKALIFLLFLMKPNCKHCVYLSLLYQ